MQTLRKMAGALRTLSNTHGNDKKVGNDLMPFCSSSNKKKIL
jgi:hypothetical protein